MKKAIYFGSLPGKLPLNERFALAKQAGLDGVEIPSDYEKQSQVEALVAAATEAGVKIHSVMCSSHWGLPLSATDEEVRLKGCDGVRHAIDVAKWAGCDNVLVVPGVVTEDVPYGAAFELSKKSIREILPAAEEAQVKLGLENVWNKFLLSPLEMRDYIDSFDHELVRAYFDVGNILMYGYPHQWIDILAERICRIHIKDFSIAKRDFVPLLTGDIDWPRVMNSLRGVGYNGYITAELSQYTLFHDQMVLDTGTYLSRILDC